MWQQPSWEVTDGIFGIFATLISSSACSSLVVVDCQWGSILLYDLIHPRDKVVVKCSFFLTRLHEPLRMSLDHIRDCRLLDFLDAWVDI